jgi:hypothetical protein
MKTTLVLLAVLVSGVSYLELRAESPSSSGGSKVAYPYGLECILTLNPVAERTIQTSSQATQSGFQADGTLRGQLIYLSDEWCVLKDGSFENWVPRDKILSMRVSK